jgi:hypothetical protein
MTLIGYWAGRVTGLLYAGCILLWERLGSGWSDGWGRSVYGPPRPMTLRLPILCPDPAVHRRGTVQD